MAEMTGAQATAPGVRGEMIDSTAWFRLWAMAALAQVLSNGLDVALRAHDVPNAILGLVAIGVLLRPSDRRLGIALLALVILSAVTSLPRVGNHWILAASISLLGLIARPWVPGWWERFVPGARSVLLVFYSFAAFAKLNTGFLDPVTSCSRFFANQLLGFWQLPEVSSPSALADVLPYLPAAIELSVPLLLIWRRTRGVGIWLGVAFHLLLALDLVQHFFDFTLVLVSLFLLFAPSGTLAALDATLPRLRHPSQRVWVAIGCAAVISTTLVPSEAAIVVGLLTTWVAWLILFVGLARGLVLRRPRGTPEPLRFLPTSAAAAVVIVIVVLNGLSPYLELKSAFGFNMYSNLTTIDGETNHLLVPGTLQLRTDQADLAIVISASDEALAEYVDSGFALPLVNLRDYLADHPDIAVSFTVGDERFDLDRAGDHPEWLERQHWLVERLLLFRAVPVDDPPVCQPSFLVAG